MSAAADGEDIPKDAEILATEIEDVLDRIIAADSHRITDEDSTTREASRETIVLEAMFMDRNEPKAWDALDRTVCRALYLDPDHNPAHYLFDALPDVKR
jgi:hypothetical protein